MAHITSVSFGPLNQGLQVGQNFGRSTCRQVKLLERRASQGAPLASLERPETPSPPFATIAFARDPGFVNRGNVLDKVHQRCSEPAGRVALVGPSQPKAVQRV
jgi:hypothetical protein